MPYAMHAAKERSNGLSERRERGQTNDGEAMLASPSWFTPRLEGDLVGEGRRLTDRLGRGSHAIS